MSAIADNRQAPVEGATRRRDLTLTPEQRHVARALKKAYGLSWPFAAHLSKDSIAAIDSFRQEPGARRTDEDCLPAVPSTAPTDEDVTAAVITAAVMAGLSGGPRPITGRELMHTIAILVGFLQAAEASRPHRSAAEWRTAIEGMWIAPSPGGGR